MRLIVIDPLEVFASSKCVYVNTYNNYNFYIYTDVKSVDVKIPISRKFLNILTRNLDLETLTDQDQKILQDQDQF